MARFGPGLERRQGFLFRVVDIGLEIFALAATIRRADKIAKSGSAEAPQAVELADFFAKQTRRHIEVLFHQLWNNDDSQATRLGAELLEGKHTWIENVLELPFSTEDLRPRTMDEIMAKREGRSDEPTAKQVPAPDELRVAGE